MEELARCQQMILWKQDGEGVQERAVEDRVVLPGSAESADPAKADADAMFEGRTDLPTLIVLHKPSADLAMLCVPESFGPPVQINGVTRATGVHLLSFGDRIDFDGCTYWISSIRSAERADYDPERHGDDLFCQFTKKRLQAGDEIVICPGRPGAVCGTIALAEAWDASLASGTRFRCANCGFDPLETDWRPTPLARARERAAELVEKASAMAERLNSNERRARNALEETGT